MPTSQLPIVGNPNAVRSSRRDKKVNMNVTLDAAAQRQYLHNDLIPNKNYTQLEHGLAPNVNTDINKFSTIGLGDSAGQRKFPNTAKGGIRPNVVGTDQYASLNNTFSTKDRSTGGHGFSS